VRTGVPVGEAQALVLEAVPAPGASAGASGLGPGAETIAAPGALGRVLAEDVAAPRSLPPDDNSAMDGYALRAGDTAGAGPERPAALRVAFEVAAGRRPQAEVGAGQAARIFTGAPVPAGADAIVRQEDTERQGELVRVLIEARPGDHVRRAGEDVREGETVLAAGSRLGPAQLGMLASLQRTVVSVWRRPRVAILSGGDELVEPDGDVRDGRIVASNAYSLAAQCQEAGADPVNLGIARDAPADIEARLRSALRTDVLVSSAGVSVGDHDHVRDVLEKLGCRIAFWGVRMKPGYPALFGRFDPPESGPLVFGLPGNPVSAMVTFEQLVRPALLKLAGHRHLFRPRLRARLAEPLHKKPGRLHFVRVRLEGRGASGRPGRSGRVGPEQGEQREGAGVGQAGADAARAGEIWARPTGTQSSGVLRSMCEAHGLLLFPAEATALAEGDPAWVQVLDPTFLAEADPGLPR